MNFSDSLTDGDGEKAACSTWLHAVGSAFPVGISLFPDLTETIMSHARQRLSSRRGRSLRVQSLERRNLLAGDGFHNFLDPADVNNDDQISALDALTVINSLNRSETSGEAAQLNEDYWDVNDDGHASAVDALMVINQLNSDQSNASVDFESKFTNATGERVKVEIESEDGIRKLEVKIQNALPLTTFDVSVAGSVVGSVTTNASGRGRLEIRSSGTSGQSLPVVNAGDSVSVGDLGTFALSGEGYHDDSNSSLDDELTDGGMDGDSDDVYDSSSSSTSDDFDDLSSDDSSDARTTSSSVVTGETSSSSSRSDDDFSSSHHDFDSSLDDHLNDDGYSDGGIDGSSDERSEFSPGSSYSSGSFDDEWRSSLNDGLTDGGLDDRWDRDLDSSGHGSSDANSDAGSDGGSD